MTTKTSRFSRLFKTARLLKTFTLLTTFSLSLLAPAAHAVFIDFDDLTYVPRDSEWPSFDDTPVTDQYLSKGLSVIDGYLASYYSDADSNHISGSNYLLGSNTLTLNFVGENLPTFVGMYVQSGGEAIFLEAFGSSGLLSSTHTAGDGGPAYSAPYVPKQYVSFEASAGIKSIQMWGAYGSRVSAYVDDLTFTYAQAEVPEPSPFILLGMGIAALAYRNLRNRR
jgi:hypothetical protein